MSRSNSPTSFLYDDKLISDHNFAMKYIKERSEKASTIQNILAPITAQDEFIFDIPVDDNASEVSELSDPFAELGGNIISSAESQQKRRLSKIEADVLVMNSFPATHMKIQNELIKEVEIPFPPQLDIDSILEGKRDSEFEDENDAEFFQQISESLDQVGIQKYNEEKKKSEDKEKNRQKTKQKRNQDDQEADSSSLMSGIWRMLDAASMDDDGFPITQPGYNFYRDKKLFVRPIEKTWTQKEEVRKKCEEWLKSLK